jgi:hypothetical protein
MCTSDQLFAQLAQKRKQVMDIEMGFGCTDEVSAPQRKKTIYLCSSARDLDLFTFLTPAERTSQ